MTRVKAALEAKANISKNLSTSINQIFKRTQGVQMLRDGWYALCQSHLNGQISQKKFEESLDNLIAEGVGLIQSELDNRKAIAPKEQEVALAREENEADRLKIKLKELENEKIKLEKEAESD